MGELLAAACSTHDHAMCHSLILVGKLKSTISMKWNLPSLLFVRHWGLYWKQAHKVHGLFHTNTTSVYRIKTEQKKKRTLKETSQDVVLSRWSRWQIDSELVRLIAAVIINKRNRICSKTVVNLQWIKSPEHFLIENQEEHRKRRWFCFINVSLPFSLLAVCFQCVTWKWSRKLCTCQGKPCFIPQLCTAWFCTCVGTKWCIDREVMLWYSQ